MDPFVGELRLVGFNFAPRGWAFCQGQLLPIQQNAALFSLLGTAYGGDGRSTFGLPDLRGRAATAFGQGAGLTNRAQGDQFGAESRTLSTSQLPAHTHTAGSALKVTATLPVTDGRATTTHPHGAVPAAGGSYAATGTTTNPVDTVVSGNVDAAGGSLPVDVTQPTLVLNYIIATTGIFPSRP